ncbi:10413_t:CDS:2, partial [Acaulospora colombiana]
ISYENMWANMALDRLTDRPPKKMKLRRHTKEFTMPKTILEQAERNVATDGEHDRHRQPHTETFEVECIAGHAPSDKQIVEQRERERSGDTIVCKHVRQHTNLVVDGGGGPEHFVDEGVDGTLGRPFDERVEEELRAAVCVFFL